jgi:cytoskeletal protein CcmA (bactofilin family)
MFEKHRNSKQQEPAVPPVQQDSSAAPVTTPASSGRAAIIGPGIHINGDINGDENLVIEGRVDGKIRLDSHQVDIGQSGRVNANITAKVIRIAGEVRGDITGTEKVIISRSGNVHGNIVAPRMTLEDGAIFKGSIDMDPGEPATAKPASPARKEAAKTVEKSTDTPKVVASGKSGGNKSYSLNGG